MDNTIVSKNCDLRTFILAQRTSENCDVLAQKLKSMGYNVKVSAVRARINYLIRKGWSSKLRAYNDLKGKRGKKSLAQQINDFDDYKPGTEALQEAIKNPRK